MWRGSPRCCGRIGGGTVDLFVLAGAVLSVIVVVTVALSSQLISHAEPGAFLLIGLA